MLDLVFFLSIILFFASSVLIIHGIEKIKG